MHPVLVAVPGALLKLAAPALFLWGAYSLLVLLARAVRAVRSAPAAAPAASAAPDAPVTSATRALPADSPANALIAIALGAGLFLYASRTDVPAAEPVERLFLAVFALGRAVVSSRVWLAAWAPLPIFSYGVMLGLSLVLGWYLTLSLAVRQGIPRDRAADCYVVTAFCAVVGSRVLYVLTNLEEFRDPSTGALVPAAMLALRTGGLVAYGGFLGGLLGSMMYLRRNGLSLWPWADAAVPSLASGLMVTRIGCYLYGCDFGRPLSASAPRWLRALGSFPHWTDSTGAPAWKQHYEHGFAVDAARCIERFHGDYRDGLCHLDATAQTSAPVHPTQLYESLVGLALFLVLALVWQRRRFQGQVFLVFGALYGLARAALEVLRDDQERGFCQGFSTSQLLGLSTAALCVGLYAWRARSAPAATGLPIVARSHRARSSPARG